MILPLRVFGSALVKRMSSGSARAPISLRTWRFQFVAQRVAWLGRFERDEHRHGFPLHLVRPADRRRLGHGRMADQRAFDFDRAQAMPGHVQHVVDAAHDPVVAVGVAAAVVAGQIVVRRLCSNIAPCSGRRRPKCRGACRAKASSSRASPLGRREPVCRCESTIAGTTPGSGFVQLPGLVAMAPGNGLIMIPPVSVCHQVSTIGQRSPPILR